jgi:hypothetical protein
MSNLSIHAEINANDLLYHSIIAQNRLFPDKTRFTVATDVLFTSKDKDDGKVFVLCFLEDYYRAYKNSDVVGFDVADNMFMVNVDHIVKVEGLDYGYIGAINAFSIAETSNGLLVCDSISFDEAMGIEKAIQDYTKPDGQFNMLMDEWFCEDEDIEVPGVEPVISDFDRDLRMMKESNDRALWEKLGVDNMEKPMPKLEGHGLTEETIQQLESAPLIVEPKV